MLRRGALAGVGAVILVAAIKLLAWAAASDAPVFEVDPFWPKPLPNSWLMGQAAGVATKGDHVSVNVNGRFAMLEGRLALIVDSAAPDGAQRLVLSWIEPGQLVGSGTSKFSWGPQGPVELKRPPVTR